MKQKHTPIWTFLALLVLAIFLIFVVYPLVLIMYKSVVNPADNSFTLANFTRFFTRKYYTNTLLNSFKVTVVSTLISATLGLVIAYITRQYRIAGSKALNICIVVSYLSPPFIGAYAWIQLLGRNGLFTKWINAIFGTSFGGIYGFAGSLLVFMRVFSDFGTPMLIGEGYRTFPVVLYNQFMGEVTNDSYFAAALCVIIMAITLIFFFLQRWISHRHSYSMSALKPMLPRPQRTLPKILCHVFVYFVVLMAMLPQLTVIVTSFLKESTPGIFTNQFSLVNYETIFSKNKLVIPNTYLYGLCAIALVIVLGVLIAYLAVRRKSIITTTVDTLTMLPYIIPGSVLGICFLYAFAKPPLALTGTAAIIIIALTVRRMPYTIRSSTAIISQISPSIEEAAVSLGASELRSFTEVTLPMMMPGVISGAIMSWVTVISELSSSIMLYRGSTQTLTVSVYTEVIRDCFGNAAAYSTVLTVTSVLSLLLFFKLTGRRDISV